MSVSKTGGSSPAELLPLVSIVTPVFNGAKYLRSCVESVLEQTHQNWEYTIVDNCSTDRSLEIAQEFAAEHPQITVKINDRFVGAVENHNRAFRSISPGAKYCKLLSADDWIYPECISKLVDLAERHPSVGIVGSYSANANGVRWGNVPLGDDVLPGREAARLYLLGEIESFWTPSTVLYQASLVRSSDPFFPGSAPSADLEACLNCLKRGDLGFVHQILSFERIHDEAMTTKVREMNSQLLDRLRILIETGPEFLTPDELERRLKEQLSDYYRVLAVGCFNFRDREFWAIHREGLGELGYSIYDPKFAKAIVAKFLDLTLNPKATAEKIVRRVKSRQRGKRPD
jgi:glycosyltransferase involved in cell wall biosynthesis